jgi:CHASE3 domain sensor protein
MKIITREEGLSRLEALAQEDPEITRRRIETRRKIQTEQKEAWKTIEARKRSQEKQTEPQS